MKAMLIIGGTGRGKSHFLKTEILPKIQEPIIYDINNEYYQEQIALPTPEQFVDSIENIKNRVFVFEEASTFFNHSSGLTTKVKNILARKRHKNQFLIFVFHALHEIPIDIFKHISTTVLFKTKDRNTLIETKFRHDEQIVEAYREVLNNPNPHYKKVF